MILAGMGSYDDQPGWSKEEEAETAESVVRDLGVRKQISAVDGQTTDVVLGKVGREIRGRGRATCLGQPVADLQVSATPLDETEDLQSNATTAAGGEFELKLAGPGPYAISVFDGHCFYSKEIKVADEDIVDLSMEIPPGRVSGRLTTPNGSPLSPVRVTLREEAGTESSEFYFDNRCHRVSTDEDGSFDFRMLPPGSYTLRAPDGHQFYLPPMFDPYGRVIRRDLHVGDSPLTDLELILLPEGRITGSVVGAAGKPAGGAHLYLKDDQGRSCSTYWETEADVTGTFEIRCVAAGLYRVVAHHDKQSAESPLVVVETGKTAQTKVELR